MVEHFFQFLETLQHSIQGMHVFGLFAFVAIFVVAQMFMAPVAPLGMAFGLFFGFGYGWLGLMLGCIIGASVNFLISRHLARKAVDRWLSGNAKFRLIDAAVARDGWKIIALLRFVPVPFGLANYCYGLTAVPFWPYLGATALAIIPPNSLFLSIGATFHGNLSSLVGKGRPHHPLEYVFLGVGVIAAVLALRYVAKVARSAVGSQQSVFPSSATHCFIVCEKERQGPYLPEQLRSMWRAGTIKADATVDWPGLPDPVPIAAVMSALSSPEQSCESAIRVSVWGVLLLVVGAACGLLASYLKRPEVFGNGPTISEWLTSGFTSQYSSTIITCVVIGAVVGLIIGLIFGTLLDKQAKSK